LELQLEEAVSYILDEVPQVDVGEDFSSFVNCIAEAIGIRPMDLPE
jgi:hypothetical protein